jgi:hypothetical protein
MLLTQISGTGADLVHDQGGHRPTLKFKRKKK